MSFRVTDTQFDKNSSSTLPQYMSDRWGFPIILLLGLAMATISWQKWADLIWDYGQQLYIPWQISQGKVLYRDVHYLFGPFSVYLHGLLFKIFGSSVQVLVWFNLGVITALSLLIYQLFKYYADTLTATLTTLAFLGIFAFGQYYGESNFNFVCAYVYELSHGVFLSFLVLYISTLNLESPTHSKWAWMGLLSGCVYLTKPEVFLALMAALFFEFYLLYKKQVLPKNSLLVFSGTFLILPILVTIYFSTQVPLTQAFYYILLPWLHVFGSNISDLPMYKVLMGTDFLADNILKMLLSFFTISGVCLGLILINQRAAKVFKNSILPGWGISLAILVSVWFWYDSFPGFRYERSLPLILTVGSIYLFWKVSNSSHGDSKRQLGLLVFSVFSFTLLLKIFFNVQVNHYGFALALPATLVLIHLLILEIPKMNFNKGLPSDVFRPVMLTLVTLTIGIHIQAEYKMYNLKGVPVGMEGDTIVYHHSFLNPIGPIFNEAIDFIQKEIPEDTSFAAIPGTVMLNFMTRRENSLKYVYLDPGAIQLIGDQQIYEELQEAHPPYIVMVHQLFYPQGKVRFGKDFGKGIHQWILKNYSLIKQYGAQPFVTEDFGIQILKRKPS
jgi:hypothetical protein